MISDSSNTTGMYLRFHSSMQSIKSLILPARRAGISVQQYMVGFDIKQCIHRDVILKEH